MTTDNAVDQLAALVKVQGELLTQTLGQLAKLAAPAPTPDPLDQLRNLLAIAKELGPPPPPLTPPPAAEATATGAPGPEAPYWIHLLDRAERIVERIVTTRQPAAPAAGAAPGSPPAGGGGTPLPAAIADLIREVCELADRNAPVELQAQRIAGQLSPEDVQVLAPLFTEDAEHFPGNIISAVPSLYQRRAWVGPFLFALRGLVEWSPAPEPVRAPRRRRARGGGEA